MHKIHDQVITWGLYYWPAFLLAVSGAFAGPELYALVTNPGNTLSDYSWAMMHVTAKGPHGVASWVSLTAWLLFVVVITGHIWFRNPS